MGAALEAEDAGVDVSITEEGLKETMSVADLRSSVLVLGMGTPSSTGQVPQLPDHNYDQQKGLPGALVLPPLPPLGTASGLNPEPRPVKTSSKAKKQVAGVDAVVMVPQAVRAQAKAVEEQVSKPDEVQHVEVEVETRIGRPAVRKWVRRLTRKPIAAGRPASPAVITAPPALPSGSSSTRGTVVMVGGKGASLPLGTPTGVLEASPASSRDGSAAKSQSNRTLFAKVVGKLNLAKPREAKPGSNEPSQPRQSRPRTALEALLGLPTQEIGLTRDSAPVKVEDVARKDGADKEIARKAGAPKAVALRVEKVEPVEGVAAKQKKARNSHGIKDGSVTPIPPTPLPDSDAELGDGSGLKGEYYTGTDFDQYEFTRADKNLDLFWGGDTSPSPKMPVGGNWSIRWTGRLMPRYSEDYTLFITADDGARMWINHKLIIDDWTLHGIMEYPAEVRLEAGKQYDIRIDYYEGGGPPAAIGFYWESKSQKREFVPQERLFYPLAGSKEDLALDEKPG